MMKRHFFLSVFIITMFAFSNSHAQNLKISGGLTFGKAIFTSDNPDNDGVDFKSKTGFLLGIGKDFAMTNTLMLDTRFSIVNLGMKLEEPENDYRFTYLSFQALMKYTIGTGLALKAGPFIDYGIAGVQKTPSGTTVKVFKEEAINRLNTGIAVGAGYAVMMGDMPIEVFASYRIGLNDTEGKYDMDNQKATLRMLSVGLTTALPY